MNPVTHFEIPYKDAHLISRFYEQVFDWQLEPLGPEMGNYILATTVTQDVKPGSPAGAINGGFFSYNPEWPDQYPSIVISVANISESMKAIQKHGGEVLGQPREIPGYGLYVAFHDPEGSRLSLIEPKM